MASCPTCAAENRDGAKFCNACGTPLTLPAAAPAEAVLESAEGVREAGLPASPVEACQGAPGPDVPGVEVEPDLHAEIGMEPSAEAEMPSAEGPEQEVAEPVPEPAGGTEATESAAGLPPEVGALLPGTLLLDRYEVVGLASRQADCAAYHARDRLCCPACGAEVPGDEDFCLECGAEHTQPAACLLREWLVEPEADEVEGEVAFEYGGRTFTVAVETPAPEEPPFAQGVRLVAGFRSVKGPDREVNQDSLLALVLSPLYEGRPTPALGLFAVADGIGGHQAGEIASRIAVQVLAQETISHVVMAELGGEICLDETLLSAIAESVVQANDQVYAAAQASGCDMGSTLAVVLVRDDVAAVANVGDSRVYHWHVDGLRQVTVDHSVVERLLAMGEITLEEAASHPQRGILYRSLGDRPSVEADVFSLRLAPGDRLLLCCDGVWESLSDKDLEEVMLLESEPQCICDAVVRRALEAGSTDNVSVVVVSAVS